MKKKIEKQLKGMGYTLVHAAFGIYGDWIVVDGNGDSTTFTTLGSIRRWIETRQS